MKALCAIVFVLSSFTISAQAQNFSGAIIEPATMSARTIAQIVATEPTVEELSPADRVTTIGSNAAKETPVEVIEPSDATQIAEHSTRSDSKLTDEAIASSAMPLRSVEAIEPRNATQISEHAAGSDSELMDEASAPSTTPARIVVTEPMGEDLSPADHIMIVGPNATKETSVEAIEPSDATQIVERAARNDSKPTDEAISPSTMPAQIVATEPTVEAADHVTIVGPNAAKETSVEAIEPSDAKRATRSELTDEAIAPSTMPAQIVVTEPTVEELSPTDHVTIVGPNAAKETSVEAIEPSDAKRATRSELTDGAIAPSTKPAQAVATEPALEQPSEADRVRTIGTTETKDVPLEALPVTDEARIANTRPGAN